MPILSQFRTLVLRLRTQNYVTYTDTEFSNKINLPNSAGKADTESVQQNILYLNFFH